jgi:hypothetical protein
MRTRGNLHTEAVEARLTEHLHDGSDSLRLIQDKIKTGFERMEDMIRHAEVHLVYSEGFHKDVVSKLKKDDDSRPEERVLAPYVFKVTVELLNSKTLVLSKPEKHAQPTLIEALDHTVDVMKKSIRHEREKWIQSRKRESRMDRQADLDMEDEPAIVETDPIAERLARAVDAKVEAFYKSVEAKA